MNLFRSEEHARKWVGYNSDYAETLQPLAYWVERFSSERYRARLRSDFVSWNVARRQAEQQQPPG
jgi:hypothetical protein